MFPTPSCRSSTLVLLLAVLVPLLVVSLVLPLALLLARHLTSAESGSLLASVARRLPANQAAAIGGNPLLQGFMNQAATAQAMPNIPEMEAVWGYLGDMLIKVVDGAADPAATVAETALLINEANGR